MYGKQYGGYRYWQGSRTLKVLESSWNLKLIQVLESPWKFQLVVESPWISVLTLSSPKGRSKHRKAFRIKLLMLWNNYGVVEGYKPCTSFRDRHTVYTHWSSKFLFRYHFLVNSFRNQFHHFHYKVPVIRDQIRLRGRTKNSDACEPFIW